MENSPEKILCAANWYKDIKLTRGDFPKGHLLPKNIKAGIVFSGHRHLQCLYQMIAMTGKVQYESGREEQGFLTSHNRFVNRREGAKIHVANGGKLNYSAKELYSEDLY